MDVRNVGLRLQHILRMIFTIRLLDMVNHFLTGSKRLMFAAIAAMLLGSIGEGQSSIEASFSWYVACILLLL